jgi:hypothetical protein
MDVITGFGNVSEGGINSMQSWLLRIAKEAAESRLSRETRL